MVQLPFCSWLAHLEMMWLASTPSVACSMHSGAGEKEQPASGMDFCSPTSCQRERADAGFAAAADSAALHVQPKTIRGCNK